MTPRPERPARGALQRFGFDGAVEMCIRDSPSLMPDPWAIVRGVN